MIKSSIFETASGPRQHSRAFGLRLIIGYHLVKAVIELVLGVSLSFLGSAGLTEELKAVAVVVRRHVTDAWSIELGNRLAFAATERNLLVTVLALLFDGALSLVEGWALYRRYRWARWLVVGATACLLPVEGVALARHISAVRIALLCVNALIVIYLVQGRVAITRESHALV